MYWRVSLKAIFILCVTIKTVKTLLFIFTHSLVMISAKAYVNNASALKPRIPKWS